MLARRRAAPPTQWQVLARTSPIFISPARADLWLATHPCYRSTLCCYRSTLSMFTVTDVSYAAALLVVTRTTVPQGTRRGPFLPRARPATCFVFGLLGGTRCWARTTRARGVAVLYAEPVFTVLTRIIGARVQKRWRATAVRLPLSSAPRRLTLISLCDSHDGYWVLLAHAP